ncbi:MAG: hypothetical protein GXP54_00865 [Deltaproteobacteria bacterium]|nr:hypothetical protein [Deltaproteobacteria bacterium]
MMKKFVAMLFGLGLLATAPAVAHAHCQMPCGIYDDGLRFQSMLEDATTITKAMRQIGDLSADPAKNANQITRWVMTKEKTADHVASVISEYFLQQRIKAPTKWDKKADEHYVRLLKAAHGILVTSMKCKQTADPANAKALKGLLEDFRKAYEE